MFHYLQNAKAGDFREYDYGPKLNWEKYGQETPPSYDLAHITTPVVMMYGTKDLFGTPGVKTY